MPSDPGLGALVPFLVRLLLMVFVWAPLATLVHELGHATAALLTGALSVQVRVGMVQERPGLKLQFGGLELLVRPFGWFYGYCQYGRSRQPVVSRWVWVTRAAGGPLASLALVAAMWLALSLGLSGFVWLHVACSDLAVCAGVQCLVSVVPQRYPETMGAYAGRASDGLLIWRALRG